MLHDILNPNFCVCNKILLEHLHTHLLQLVCVAFELQQQNWVVATGTLWPTKAKRV